MDNFLIDWRHKRLKNKTDLLLFYREHFLGFSEHDLWKLRKKPIHFTTDISVNIYGLQIFSSFMQFYFVHIVKVCFVFKNSRYAYIPPYMHKTLPTLGNEKEQSQIKFYKNPRANWFSRGRLKISEFHFDFDLVLSHNKRCKMVHYFVPTHIVWLQQQK